MTIGEIARKCDLRTSAIRYYEEVGLLPKPPRAGGQRVYGTDAIHRIAFIQFAQQAGFTLAEIGLLSGTGASARPLSARMRKLAAEKIQEVQRMVERATLMKAMLTRALSCQCLDAVECGGKILARRARAERNCRE
jgi:MerR family transcriptional regulator, redox-sensitive transcriptional activator SoxR